MVALVTLSFLFVWAWHILLPEKLHYAKNENLDIIQAVLVSIIGSSSLTGYAKNWLSRNTDN